MASTSDLFSQALLQLQRGGQTPSEVTDLATYDPTAALQQYGAAAGSQFNTALNQNLKSLQGRAASAGRLKTGFYDQDVGRLTTNLAQQYQTDLAGEALGAAQLKANTLGTAAGYAEDEQNRYLDVLSGQLDREQARKNQVAQQQSSVWGTAGEVAGAALPFLLSSERFKDNVEPLDDASERLKMIPGRRFTYKGDDQPQVGVMAEDVDRAMPEAAMHDASGQPAAVDYAKLVPLLIEATREQGDAIEQLKAELRRGQPMAPPQRSYEPAEVM